ncbi:MAG: guanylate kinase, partial [Deferribacterales bacterium]|nr:guanylate kinase [Deferribacterales bacterium]
PSLNELKTRLINRGTDRIDVIENRLINAKKEVQYFSDYDYLIINDESDKAFADMEAIYRAEKLRTTYFKNVLDFMDI